MTGTSTRLRAGALCRLCGVRPRQVFPSGASSYCVPCRRKREAELHAARGTGTPAPPATPASFDASEVRALVTAAPISLAALDVAPAPNSTAEREHEGADREGLDASARAGTGGQAQGAQDAQGEDRERQVYRLITDSVLLLDRARVLAESGAVEALQITADLSSGSVLELRVRGKAQGTGTGTGGEA